MSRPGGDKYVKPRKITVSKKLNELFDEARQRNLKEDFEIGQAAQALQEVKRATKEFYDFLEGPFAKTFKNMHNDPRNIEDNVSKLGNALRVQRDKLSKVVDEMDSYLDSMDTYLNPESMHKGQQNDNRWTRWEHRTPRHLNRDDE